MKKYQIIIAGLLCISVNYTYGQYGDHGFLHNTSSNISFITSAKKLSINGYNGYVWAGIYPTASSTQVDFVIEKVSTSSWCSAGCMYSSGSFSKEYAIQSDPNCANSYSYPHGCIGVDIIETAPTLGGNEMFAIAGAFNGGIFFATLNASGSVLSKQYWAVPGANHHVGKPSICQSANPLYYYICGKLKDNSYVIKVNYTGAVIWARLYDNIVQNNTLLQIEGRDIIESPYNANELIVVGKCQYDSYFAADAFFLSLDASNGNVNNFLTYNDGLDGDEWFNAIEPAASTFGGSNGYILGGRVVSINNPSVLGYTPWMIKLDPTGNPIWSTLIPQGVEEITDVFERWNPLASPQRYEYFGIAGDLDLMVWKLDESGGTSISPNFFQYNIGSGVAGVTDRTYPQLEPDGDGSNTYDGFAAWGTDISASRYKLNRAYYNGVNGCESSSDLSIVQGPGINANPALTSSTFQIACPYFQLSTSSVGSYSIMCNWLSSVTGGSNLKTAGVTGLNTNLEVTNLVSVYPNPSSGEVAVEIGSHSGPIQIKLMNAMGQLVKNLLFSEEHSENRKILVNFQDLKLSEGLYFMDVTVQNQTQTKKVVYQK